MVRPFGVTSVVALDAEGLPDAPCPACGGGMFHAARGEPWRCSGCEPPSPPAEALAGWRFAHVPTAHELEAAGSGLSAEGAAHAPPAISLLGLRTLMEETCAAELVLVRRLARSAREPLP